MRKINRIITYLLMSFVFITLHVTLCNYVSELNPERMVLVIVNLLSMTVGLTFSLLMYSYMERKQAESNEKIIRQTTMKAKKDLWEAIGDSDKLTETLKISVPLRNYKGEKIGEGSVYSMLSDIYRTEVLNKQVN